MADAALLRLGKGDVMEWMLMPLKRYADFSGRSRRMEYWMWVVFQMLIAVAFWILTIVIAGSAVMALGMGSSGKDPGAVVAAGVGMGIGIVLLFALYGLLGLFLIIPSLAVAVRRLHDTNRSGWWLLAPLACECVAFLAFGMAGASAGTNGSSGAAVPAMIGFIAVIGALGLGLMLLVFMFLDGTPGPNRYGPDPKNRVQAAVFS